MALTVGSLFSGIGGLDLGLERAGMKVIWQSEIDPYANKILKKHWPEVPNHGDIKKIDWGNVVRPNVICGGYPCQPFSNAGKRRGENDPRHLWPWVRDAISRLRPDYAILENVRGHLSMGGLTVIGELASIGYDAEWRIVSAASVGANHRRDRIIIVAYPTGEHCDGVNHHSRDCEQSKTPAQFGNGRGSQDVAYSSEQFCNGRRNGNVFEQSQSNWLQSTPRGKSGYGGLLHWQVEPNVGRVADGVPNRLDRLRGLGNAVVPQVAEVIGRLVVAHAETI